jgi:two-component system sensor histidine kinase BarA
VPARVVLRAAGPATRDALAAGLRGAGFEPVDSAGRAPAHWILDAAALMAAGRRPEGADRVLVVGGQGDTAADAALRAGLADEVLRWPVTQGAWQPVLTALAEGGAFAVPAALPAARAVPAEPLPRFPGTRVLVADDSAVNREVALEALARCGVTDVVAVADGAAAVEAAAARRFALILMDGSMPVLDGFAAARTIRQREAGSGRRTPIIALTAHVLADAAEAASASGMDGTLGKPFTLTQLVGLLRAHAPARPDLAPGAPAPVPVPADGPRGDLLDGEVLDGLLGLGDSAFLDRIVDLYRQQAPTALAVLRAVLGSSDQPGIAQAAHSLKSMSANIGARALVERLRAIELAARDARCAEPQSACDGLEALLAATIRELDGRTRIHRAA